MTALPHTRQPPARPLEAASSEPSIIMQAAIARRTPLEKSLHTNDKKRNVAPGASTKLAKLKPQERKVVLGRKFGRTKVLDESGEVDCMKRGRE